MTNTDTPLAYKFVQANYYSRGNNLPITRIVMHDEESPVSDNSAESVAEFFRTGRTGSAHYVVDGNSVVQCVKEAEIAYHAPPNTHSIGIEMDGYARFSARDWNTPGSQATLHRAAILVVDIARRRGVPLDELSSAEVAAGKHGICGHVDVSRAFHQSDHSDPGAQFPWPQFMGLLEAASGCPVPVQPPAIPTPVSGRAKPTGAPRFPLPSGSYFGPVSGPSASVSGYHGHHGPGDLVLWQQRMLQRGWTIACDGYYGGQSAAVVTKFQAQVGLATDGKIGPATWAAAWTARVT